MKAVIVAKTRMGSGACVGGLTFDGRSVRLIPLDRDTNDQFNMEYSVGDVWDLTWKPDPHSKPPHIENILVTDKKKLPPIDDLGAFITHQAAPKAGGTELLFDGLTQTSKGGVQYVAEGSGIPGYSTMFWRPDADLEIIDDSKRIRYRYPDENGGRTLTYVGFQEPLARIPAGTLLRVSLAHWWRPREKPEGELRCYVQLSGWYETDTTAPRRDSFNQTVVAPAPVSRPAEILNIETAQKELKRVFGYDSFRPLQAETIQSVLSKRDSLAIMPTGSGKSVCYQIPALMFGGLTVVVSPLISLMQDQVDQLRERGVAASYLNSSLSFDDYISETAAVRAGQTRLLYAAPETLLRPETIRLLEQVPVDCLAIDEAHCISAWGHDFRPEYRELSTLRRRLPEAVCIATTATATARVREDIKRSLAIEDAGEFVASFDRPNLVLAAAARTNGFAQLQSFLDRHRSEAGIIYCNTIKDVESLAALLNANGRRALAYHAGLDNETRRRNQRRFIYEEGMVVVATIAFGMGINKSNVRFIAHYGLPKNLESYYQQIGRAGRDGLPADCLLLWSYQDASTIRYFIDQEAPSQQQGSNARLQGMLDFAGTRQCRRVPLLAYFGETYQASTCGHCDNCLEAANEKDEPLVDLTLPAQKFLSCVLRTRQMFGQSHIIDILRGSRSKRVLSRGHDQLSTHGIGKEYSKAQWQELVDEFLYLGVLQRDQEYGSLKLTEKGREVLQDRQVHGRAPSGRRATRQTTSSSDPSYDPILFEQLRVKRTVLARENNVPPYVIFSDRTLVEMAQTLPPDEAAFGALNGVGEVKLRKYASHFLPIVNAYRQTQNDAAVLSDRTLLITTLYNNGTAIPDLAEQQQIKPSTVLDHLWRATRAGQPIRPEGILVMSHLSQHKQQQVQAAFAELGTAKLRPVYEHLEESVGFDELRVVRLYILALENQARLTTN